MTGSTSDASRSIKDLENNLDTTERRLSSFGSALSSLGRVTVIGSLVTGAVQLAAALAPALGILAALPAVAAAAAAGISTLFVGIQGISAAFKTSAAATGGAATNLTSYQRAVEAAQRGITDAEKNVTRAERDLSDAQEKAKESQDQLDQARQEAAQTLAAYTDKVVDARLAEESANLAVQDAQNNLQQVQSSGTETAIKLAEAQLAVSDATANLHNVQANAKSTPLDVQKAQLALAQANQQLVDEQTTASHSGLQLQEAQLQVAEATQRAKEATESSTQTQQDANAANAAGVDGAQTVVKAQRDLALANREVSDAQDKVVDSQQKVILAQQQLADAQQALANATNGGSAAINKQAQALAALSPNARAFVETVLGLKTQWDSLKNSVQNALFAGISAQVTNLARVSFPTLRTGMTSVATGFNEIAVAGSAAVQTPAFQGAMAASFTAARKALDDLLPAIGPLITGFANLVRVGLPFFNRFVEWAANGLRLAGAFLSSAEGADKMRQVLDRASTVLGQLWNIGVNVGKVIANIFKGADAGNLLQAIQNVTGAFAQFTGSAQGQKDITGLFTALGQIAGSTAGVLPQVARAAADLASAFSSLPQPMQSMIAEFAAWSIVMGPTLTGVSNVSRGIKGVIDVAGGIGKGISAGWDIAGKAISRFQELQRGEEGATSLFTSGIIGKVGTMASSMSRAAASFIADGARMVASMVVTAATTVAGWVAMAAGAVANAAIMAASWLVAIWPIALVIAAVVGLVALIIYNWGTISSATAQLWSDIKQWTSDAWKFITGAIGAAINWIAGVPGQIGRFLGGMWNGIETATGDAWDWVVNKIVGVLNWFGGLGNQIGRLTSGMWNGIKDSFKYVINTIIGWWDNLQFSVPSVHIPGTNDNIGGFTLGTPNIPFLAAGGVVKARPGGTLVGLAEAGVDEAVVPLDGRHSLGTTVEYHPTYQFNAPIYGVDDLQKVLDDHDKKLIQLLEAHA